MKTIIAGSRECNNLNMVIEKKWYRVALFDGYTMTTVTTDNQPEKRLVVSTGIKPAKQTTLGTASEIAPADDEAVVCCSPLCLRHLITRCFNGRSCLHKEGCG